MSPNFLDDSPPLWRYMENFDFLAPTRPQNGHFWPYKMAYISETVKYRETRHIPLDSGFLGGHFMLPTFFDDSPPVWRYFNFFDFLTPKNG